jgi:hypothetical protein
MFNRTLVSVEREKMGHRHRSPPSPGSPGYRATSVFVWPRGPCSASPLPRHQRRREAGGPCVSSAPPLAVWARARLVLPRSSAACPFRAASHSCRMRVRPPPWCRRCRGSASCCRSLSHHVNLCRKIKRRKFNLSVRPEISLVLSCLIHGTGWASVPRWGEGRSYMERVSVREKDGEEHQANRSPPPGPGHRAASLFI